MSLYLKWVSFFKQCIVGVWFLVYTDNLCLLMGDFKLLICKVIIDVIGLISTIFATVLYLWPFFPSFFLLYTLFALFVVFRLISMIGGIMSQCTYISISHFTPYIYVMFIGHSY